jgi:hypothetical protein
MGRNIQAKRVRDLAAMIMDSDIPEKQAQEIKRLQGICRKQAADLNTEKVERSLDVALMLEDLQNAYSAIRLFTNADCINALAGSSTSFVQSVIEASRKYSLTK